MHHGIDKTLLAITGLLVAAGFFIFTSASLGLLARDGASFTSVAFSQIVFGIIGGSIAMFFSSAIHYRIWRKYAIYVFLASIALTLMVFVPGIGFSHGGATRWLHIGSFTFQPAEVLKIGFIIYIATWLSGVHKKIETWRYGTLPFFGITGAVGIVMLMQPDTDTFVIMGMAATAMFITAGGKWSHVITIGSCAVVMLVILAFTRPYIKDRIMTFIDPSLDPQGSGYQIKQSLIAIGSGQITGRGFGQSIQKFEYLPEPIGDSVFAVYSEEFGFLGSSLLIALITGFALRGYKIASRATDLFGMLLVVGIMTVIIAQAFLNIAAMVALVPLSGLPLPFISHGGTALMVTLASVALVLNVSKYQRRIKA